LSFNSLTTYRPSPQGCGWRLAKRGTIVHGKTTPATEAVSPRDLGDASVVACCRRLHAAGHDERVTSGGGGRSEPGPYPYARRRGCTAAARKRRALHKSLCLRLTIWLALKQTLKMGHDVSVPTHSRAAHVRPGLLTSSRLWFQSICCCRPLVASASASASGRVVPFGRDHPQHGPRERPLTADFVEKLGVARARGR
jgi:hypothetical protein